MNTLAVVLEEPEHLVLSRLDLSPPGDEDVVVDIEWSGISTGTERLLWSGRMPHFPGHGLSAGARIRIGRPGGRGRVAIGTCRSASACSCPARAATAKCAVCSAARRHASSCPVAASCRSTNAWASRACCSRWPRPPITRSPAPTAAAGSHRRPRRARPPARAACRCVAGGAPPVVWERNPERVVGR